MKTHRRPAAAVLLISMLLSLLGGGYPSAAAAQTAVTVKTDRELAFDPLAPSASVAYERHAEGYSVSLDRAADSVTINIASAPGVESARAAEGVQLFIHTGAALKPGTAYQVSFSLFAEHAQQEYAVCFDGGSEEAVYGALEGRSVKAGGIDQVKYQITPQAEHGELVLRLLLGKTEGNTLCLSNLTVGEAPKNVTGRDVVLADNLDYHAPGFIRFWTHTDRAAAVACGENSATLTVTKGPVQGAEVWKIKLFVATGLTPAPGKTYHFSVDLDSTAQQAFELCYNEGDTEKGYGAAYSQRLTGQSQTLDYIIQIPKDKVNPGELIFQFSLGRLKTGDQVTISNIRLEEAFPSYRSVLSEDFSFHDNNTSVAATEPVTRVTGTADAFPAVNWADAAAVTKSGDYAGELTLSGGSAALEINGGQNVWDARLNIDTAASLKAGASYRVTFDIQADKPYSEYEVLYGAALNGVDNDQTYGALKGLSLAAGRTESVECMIHPKAAGGLLISLLAGKTEGRDNTVTVSGFKIEEMVPGQPSGGNLASVTYPSESSTPTPPTPPAEDPGSFSVRADGSYGGTITGDGSSATMTCTGGDAGDGSAWKRGMFTGEICRLSSGTRYLVSFDIESTAATPFEVCYNKDDDWSGEKGFGWQGGLTAGPSKTTVTYVAASDGNSALKLRIDLGRAAEGTKVTVSSIQVRRLEGAPSGGNLASLVNYGSFSSRDPSNGSVSSSSSSATITCTGGDAGEGNAWQRGMFTGDICRLSAGDSYQVRFDITATADTPYEVCYNKDGDWGDSEGAFGHAYSLTASPASSTATHIVTPAADGQLRLRIDLGRAAENTQVTVSNIQVQKIEEAPAGGNLASVDYPSGGVRVRKADVSGRMISGAQAVSLMEPDSAPVAKASRYTAAMNFAGARAAVNPGSFRVREVDSYGGFITGDGDSAAITCTGGDAGEPWKRGLFIDNLCRLSAGSSYLVTFDIEATAETPFEVCYNKDEDWGAGEKGFGAEYGLTAHSAKSTVEHTITPAADGQLRLRVDLGRAAEGAKVTVSNIRVRTIGYAAVSEETIDGFGSVWAEGIDGYTADLTRGQTSAVLRAAKSGDTEPAGWKAKLFIRTGVVYDPDKSYRAQFDLSSENGVNEFCVISQGVPDSEDIRGTWGLTIGAGETKTVTTRPVPAGMGAGELVLQLELGNFNGTENVFTVSNVKVEEVRLDTSYEYRTNLTCRGTSASLAVKDTPAPGMMEFWKVKLFTDTGVYAEKGETYRVTFDTWAFQNMDFEVCYNRDDEESGFGSVNGLHAAGNRETSVEHFFTASRDGILKLQIMLGKVQDPNIVSVRNLRVERVAYTYAPKSALPAGVEYKTPGAVSYWAHEDYAADFTGSDSAITAHITSAPEKGAEPWKVKLFLDTGVPLQGGKYYKVTASVRAEAAQDYEICYNNGGAEMGYDSLGGLRLEAGRPQAVEKIIAVPKDKTDLNSLTLQFNLGKTTAANAVTVSGVKVEEVSLSYTGIMPEDFTYTPGGTVSVWTNPDYTASAEGSDGAAVLHITDVPAAGAEVWKTKLFIDTGAILSAGGTYLVRADLLSAKSQSYEVCFNNEETEKGFDVLYNQTITAGRKTTVEKQITVPASMTDAGKLILQFAVGGPEPNDITVSGVTVQELTFGAGSGDSSAGTVINLSGAADTLDVTREKLTFKTANRSSGGGDSSLAIAGADLRRGELYTVSFTARADQELTGTFVLHQADSAVLSQPFRLTSRENTYSFTTRDPLAAGGAYSLLWRFASPENRTPGGTEVEISKITVSSPPETLEIVHGKQTVTVNGKSVPAESYNINGSNYVKLRDLALLLNDTNAQFVVRYNGKKNLISLTSGKPYTPVGGELTAGENLAATCTRSTLSVAVNGKTVNLKGYHIGRNNFFRLRDLDELLGFKVEYVAASNTAAVTSPLTPEAQEKAHAYDLFFLPEIDGESQPYAGDTMPYYEDGVYYIYYLKDGGDSYNHSVYLTTTADFVTYTEYDDPVLSASREDVQDNWIGTGSVVKADDVYYLFYTGFNSSGSQEYHEKIMVAKGSSPTSFEKVGGWEIVPPAELGQKNDFRDPQAYYDPASGTISLTVTASKDGAARILKFTLGKDLRNVRYDGIIFTDPTGEFWNLECSDTFQIGNKWYLTYSGQEDTLWYAMADSRFGPYSNPARLEGKLFYAAKHVENGTDAYMVGWARRGNSASSTLEVSGWAGNIAVQKLSQREDGSLLLVPVDSIVSAFSTEKPLAPGASQATLTANAAYSYQEAFTSCESFMLKGEFTYSGTGSFGLAFDFNGNEEQYKLISIDPNANRISLSFNEGATPITETQATLRPNQKHSFTYIQDGSVGIFYLDGQAALLVRLYGVTDKPIYLFAENNSVTFTSLRQYTR